MVHFSASNLDSKSFLKNFNPKKKYAILDYGCGVGIWSDKLINKNFFKVIYLFDKNKASIEICKKKYTQNKIIILNNLSSVEKILNKKIINVVLLNSVIQYIPKTQLEKLLLNFKKKLPKKSFKIIIADIPRFSRFIEFFWLFIFDPLRFFHAIKLIFKFNSYQRDCFYLGNLKEEFLKQFFRISKVNNINHFKFRWTFILKNKFML